MIHERPKVNRALDELAKAREVFENAPEDQKAEAEAEYHRKLDKVGEIVMEEDCGSH